MIRGDKMIDMINHQRSSLVDFNYNSMRLKPDQREAVEQILYNYDPKKMTPEKSADMLDEIRSIGIRPNAELKNMLIRSGFEMPESNGKNGDRNNINRSPIKSSAEIPARAMDFAEKLNTGQATNEDVSKMIELLQQYNRGAIGNFVDGSV
jgi:hypothetical protein